MKFILAIILVALVPLTSLGGTGPGETAEDPTPNILILVTDDQRPDFPEAEAVMPNLRQYMANNGTRFTECFGINPLCCAGRASIWCGCYSHNNGVFLNSEAGNLDHYYTIQRVLQQEKNFLTGYIGKFFNGWPLTTPPPFFQWHTMADYGAAGCQHSDVPWEHNGVLVQDERYGSVASAAHARAFLNWAEGVDDDAPWFLVVSFFEPHQFFTPEEQYEDASVTPPNVIDKQTARKQLRMLMSVDDAIGSIFDKMDSLGEKSDTLVFVVSDNGLELGEHGYSNRKGVPYEMSVRIPLYMRWPDHVARGATDSGLVANVDIAPTILEAVGLPADTLPVDGRSLLHPSTRTGLLLEGCQGSGGSNPIYWKSLYTPEFQYSEYDDGRVEYEGTAPIPGDLPATLAAVADCEGQECYLEDQ